jgi:hypothetical protein
VSKVPVEEQLKMLWEEIIKLIERVRKLEEECLVIIPAELKPKQKEEEKHAQKES